jgi:nucleoside-diphosphate-sugar epimerase
MKKCAITGATGLVGQVCVKHLEKLGYAIVLLQRSNEYRSQNIKQHDVIPFNLTSELKSDHLKDIDVLIHCAYDFTCHTWETINVVNIQGSIRLFEVALEAGIKKIIFISSISAYTGCRSLYGQGKLLVENWILKNGGIVLRPGLVYGDVQRGMFGALYKMTAFPMLPVLDGGYQELYLIHVEDLAVAIAKFFVTDHPELDGKLFTLAHGEPILFRDLLFKIAQIRGKKIKLFSISSQLALKALRMLEIVGLSFGFKSDSLLALIYPNKNCHFLEPSSISMSFQRFGTSV